MMDYSVSDLTFHVYDNGNEVYSRKYLVQSMLVPQGVNEANGVGVNEVNEADNKNPEGIEEKAN